MTPHWRAALRRAVLDLALAPDAFWRLSLAEWRALNETPAPAVLTRAALDGLMARFPDHDPRGQIP